MSVAVSGNVKGGGSYYLENDITWEDGNFEVAQDLNLCLNGHSIDLKGGHIVVTNNATLTLFDEESDTEHYFKVEESGLWTLQDSESDKTVTGGIITGGGNLVDHRKEGGAVYVCVDCRFVINGGSIVGNQVCYSEDDDIMNGHYGGGVYVDGGSFVMNGGSIVGNVNVGGVGSGVA